MKKLKSYREPGRYRKVFLLELKSGALAVGVDHVKHKRRRLLREWDHDYYQTTPLYIRRLLVKAFKDFDLLKALS